MDDRCLLMCAEAISPDNTKPSQKDTRNYLGQVMMNLTTLREYLHRNSPLPHSSEPWKRLEAVSKTIDRLEELKGTFKSCEQPTRENVLMVCMKNLDVARALRRELRDKISANSASIPDSVSPSLLKNPDGKSFPFEPRTEFGCLYFLFNHLLTVKREN